MLRTSSPHSARPARVTRPAWPGAPPRSRARRSGARRSGARALALVRIVACCAALGGLAGIAAGGPPLPPQEADETAPEAEPRAPIESKPGARPRVGLVLSGGGARGGAHLGVIEVLEELRIPIDVVVGTSMGSIVGGFYAAGLSPADIRHELGNTDWSDALTDKTPLRELAYRRKLNRLEFLIDFNLGMKDWRLRLPRGVLQGQKLNVLLERATWPAYSVKDFDHLRIPFRAVATDIETGGRVVLGGGSLATAIRASMSVPGVFAPVVIDGRPLVDGGIVDNLPVDVARDLGVDVVIAVDVTSPLLSYEELTSFLSVMNQVVASVINWNVDDSIAALGEQDTLIRPELSGVSSADFGRVLEAAARGRVAADALREQLEWLSVSEGEWTLYLASQRMDDLSPPVIDEIRVENNSRLADRAILERLRVRVGERLDFGVLDADVRAIYGLNIFEQVDFVIKTEGDRHILVLRTVEKVWGPTYIRFSTSVQSDFGSRGGFTIGTGMETLPIDDTGAEWRNEVQLGTRTRLFTEYYKPLDYKGQKFFSTNLRYFNRPASGFFEGQEIGAYRVDSLTATIGIGRSYSDRAQLRAGFAFETGEVRLITGVDTGLAGYFNDGGPFIEYSYNSLDNVAFPTRGISSDIVLFSGNQAFGSAENYTLLQGDWNRALSSGLSTFIPGVDIAATLDGEVPIHRSFTRGGFLNLSGISENQFIGQQSALLRVVYYRQLGTTSIPGAKKNLYLGASLELGGIWQEWRAVDRQTIIPAGSAFMGTNTLVGPLYMGYGLAEGGQGTFFMFVGRAF